MGFKNAVTQITNKVEIVIRKHWLKITVLSVVGWLATGASAPYLEDAQELATQTVIELLHFETTPSHVSTIGVDDGVYYSINKAHQPIDPEVFIKLLDLLLLASVLEIAIDFDFSDPFAQHPGARDPQYAPGLSKLKSAICRAATQVSIVLPLALAPDAKSSKPSLLENLPCNSQAIHYAFINLSSDLRFVQTDRLDGRTMKVTPSFPLAIARFRPGAGVKDPIVQRVEIGTIPPMASFLAPGTLPLFKASRLLEMESAEVQRRLKGQVAVLMGTWSVGTPGSGVLVDVVDTPFGSQFGGWIQAVQAESILSRRLYYRVAPWIVSLGKTAWIAALALAMGLSETRWQKVGVVVVSVAAGFVLTVVLTAYGLTIDFFAPLLLLIVHPMIEQVLDWREKARYWEKVPHDTR